MHKFKSVDMTSYDFKSLVREADIIFQKYHLDCNYISSKDAGNSYISQKQKILFHDNYYFSPVKENDCGRYINAIYSPEKEINEIFYSRKAHPIRPGEERIDLPALLSRINWFFWLFQTFVGEYSKVYCKKQNDLRGNLRAGKSAAREMTLEDAQSTIYYDFGLDREADRVFLNFLKEITNRDEETWG